MVSRFIESLNTSANKIVRKILKSGNESNVWEYWRETLQKRTDDYNLGDYRKRLTYAIPPHFTFLQAACELAELKSCKTINLFESWVENYESLVRELDSLEEPGTVKGLGILHTQLLGELGLLLGTLFYEIKSAQVAEAKGRELLAEGLSDLLDGAGLPDSENILLLRPLLACWTRCQMLAKMSGTAPWKQKLQDQFEWVVLQTLRFTRKDGSQVFGEPQVPLGSGRNKKDCESSRFLNFMEQSLAFDHDLLDTEVAQIVCPGRKTVATRKSKDKVILPEAQYFSDWSKVAVLRNAWEHDQPSLSIQYGNLPKTFDTAKSKIGGAPFGGWTDSRVLTELNFKSKTIFSGIWNVSVLQNDKPLITSANWTPACEINDPKCLYFELYCNLSNDYCLQRHFLLVPDEDILILADSFLPSKESRGKTAKHGSESTIRYESRFQLSPSIVEHPGEPGGTERMLFDSETGKESPLLRILPLGLSEWENDDSSGELQLEGNTLVFRQHGKGCALFAPLLFDLSPTRIRYPYTWRRLTVGEKLARVSNDQAIGFRIQLYKEQFLLYRSLTESRNRTVLGHNLVSDFFLGRFHKEKGVEKILEVEED